MPAAPPAPSAAAQLVDSRVATAVAVEGTVFVTRGGARQALLARNSGLQVGDAIHTTRNSSVRVRFTDGGETVVRPESTLLVQDYRFKADEPQQDSLILRLLKGGIRALTGAVGKRGNQDAYQLNANTATIGIRGTDFSARLCQQDCADASDSTVRNSAPAVAARAVELRGQVLVSRAGAAAVPLQQGQPLYSGDGLQTGLGAYVVLVFSDGTKLTVNPSSQMAIADYAHDASAQASSGGVGRMIIDMFKGGLRFATGLIGKTNPEKVKVRTANATIGIRGTVFDVVCAPSAGSDAGGAGDLGDMPCDQSVFAQTREGLISLTGSQGEPVLIPAGQSGRVPGANVPARTLAAPPAYFRDLQTPAPESVPANVQTLFGSQAAPDTNEGVILTVHEGRVVLAQAQRDILLDAGESAFAGKALAPIRLISTPPALDRDPFLSKGMFNATMCRK
jgi:hypothetical protein